VESLNKLVPVQLQAAPRPEGRPSAAASIHSEVAVTDIPYRIALIVGAGSGISTSVARGLAS
jgi:hypothetical protein